MANSDFTLKTIPGDIGLQLAFNLQTDSAIQDLAVRQAITHCLDRENLAVQIGGVVGNSYIHLLDPAYLEVIAQRYAPQQGRELLQASGQTALTLTLITRDVPERAVVANQIVADLAICGITVQVEALTPEALYTPWPDGRLFGGQYDMALLPLVADDLACQRYWSGNIPGTDDPAGLNVTRFQDVTFDRSCTQAVVALEANDLIQQSQAAQMLWGEALPALPLFWYEHYAVVDCHVTGFAPDPTAVELWNIEELDLVGACS